MFARLIYEVTLEQKPQVARYMLESGNKWVIVKYSKQWGGDLKESSVRTQKDCGRGSLRSRCQSKRCQIENKDDYCCLEINWTQQCRLM